MRPREQAKKKNKKHSDQTNHASVEIVPEQFILRPGGTGWGGGEVERLMRERNKTTYNLAVPLSNRGRQILQHRWKYTESKQGKMCSDDLGRLPIRTAATNSFRDAQTLTLMAASFDKSSKLTARVIFLLADFTVYL